MTTTRRNGLLLLAALLPFTSHAKVLFDFNTKPIFYNFKNAESEVTVSLSDESALPNSKSVQAAFKVAGPQSYIGIGVGFSYLAPWMAQWETFNGLTIVAKSAEPTKLAIQVIIGDKTYATDLNTTKDWTRFTIPFADFKSKGESLNPKGAQISKLVLRPGRNPAINTLFVDEITLEENITAAKQEPVAPTPAK